MSVYELVTFSVQPHAWICKNLTCLCKPNCDRIQGLSEDSDITECRCFEIWDSSVRTPT